MQRFEVNPTGDGYMVTAKRLGAVVLYRFSAVSRGFPKRQGTGALQDLRTLVERNVFDAGTGNCRTCLAKC